MSPKPFLKKQPGITKHLSLLLHVRLVTSNGRGLSGFTQLEVLDFRREDIEQFIRSWFDFRPKPSQYATAADLQVCLARTPRIQALAANPLLLSLIVLVYEEQLDLPDRRAELYSRCIETLLTNGIPAGTTAVFENSSRNANGSC